MGAIIAKFRKEKTSTEILEDLEERIIEIEKYSFNTQEQQKRFVGNFLTASVGVYVIAFVIFYFVYFPPTWRERGIYSVPLLLFPIVVILLRKLFTWYFQRKLNKNSKRLKELRAEKKKILEEVMDKEKYKVAVKLLARFGDKSFNTRPLIGHSPKPGPAMMTNALVASQKKPQFGMNMPPASLNRTVNQLNTSVASSSSLAMTPSGSGDRSIVAAVGPYGPRQLGFGAGQMLRRRTPYPVLDLQNKTFFDRIVDVLMGDGPQDRFAMICQFCYGHNGMAMKDDFEFSPFRCAFCHNFNPARKKREAAPRLTDSPDSNASSSSDSDHQTLLNDDQEEKDQNEDHEEDETPGEHAERENEKHEGQQKQQAVPVPFVRQQFDESEDEADRWQSRQEPYVPFSEEDNDFGPLSPEERENMSVDECASDVDSFDTDRI